MEEQFVNSQTEMQEEKLGEHHKIAQMLLFLFGLFSLTIVGIFAFMANFVRPELQKLVVFQFIGMSFFSALIGSFGIFVLRSILLKKVSPNDTKNVKLFFRIFLIIQLFLVPYLYFVASFQSYGCIRNCVSSIDMNFAFLFYILTWIGLPSIFLFYTE